jgi:hypothetical protein
VKRGTQRRSDELQAKRKDGKKQPEMTRAASSPAYSPVSPTPCLQTGLVLSAAPMEGPSQSSLGEIADRCKFIDRECIDGNSTVWGHARPACEGETYRRPGGNRSSARRSRPPGGDKPMYKATRVAYPGVVKGNHWHKDHYCGDRWFGALRGHSVVILLYVGRSTRERLPTRGYGQWCASFQEGLL